MKIIFILMAILAISACSHAPEPKQARGDWFELNTTIEQVKAGTY
ncbi:traF protein [Escherichia coli]|nr:traF protein [Escherichia coli]MCQ5518021.1 traF protein [Escherichia coli]MCQ5553209.1 traF protein [Escherichia coli]MCQ5564472.1 traF protein [Escherichia coli]MCQ5584689.1 traF protein [Escherichia coli]